MSDEKFINFITEQCKKLHQDRIMMEQKAKVSIDFMRLFRNKLILHIEKHKNERIVRFRRKDVLESPCSCDIRQYMDNDLINELATKGYAYLHEASSCETIVLSNKN